MISPEHMTVERIAKLCEAAGVPVNAFINRPEGMSPYVDHKEMRTVIANGPMITSDKDGWLLIIPDTLVDQWQTDGKWDSKKYGQFWIAVAQEMTRRQQERIIISNAEIALLSDGVTSDGEQSTNVEVSAE